MHTSFRPAHSAAIALLLLLVGCTHAPRALDEPAQGSVSEESEALQIRYASDLDACRRYAAQIGVVNDTLDGIVQGALLTAAVVWGLGGGSQARQDWALAGAALGGAGQASQALERRRQVEVQCMAGRGHRLVASIPTPPLPVPNAPVAPVWQAPPPPTGTDAFNAERLAREQSCSPTPLATLAAKGPGFETYTVACTNADALAIRCEWGQCRVLR